MPKAEPKPLPIARGRRFECTHCGNCCVRDGDVSMTPAEEKRIAAFLGRTVPALRKELGTVIDRASGRPTVRVRDAAGCPLLTPERGCSVHAVKPAQCRTWPFWTEMVEDRREWEASKSFCPGLDAPGGRRYTRREILAILDEDG
ncbi:MAG: YkgJ family cysteine cluster protein [Deltaproteobacteria bacterium]|nr:YkgJ family cysteine cluster protein [Deltaproteobacteria bacterium]